MGHLLGGCFETFHMLRGTKLFPKLEEFNDSILFFETSEEKPPIWYLENELRFLGSMYKDSSPHSPQNQPTKMVHKKNSNLHDNIENV